MATLIIIRAIFNYFCPVTNKIMWSILMWYVSFWAPMEMCGYLYKNSNISHCAVDDSVKDIKHSSLTHIVFSIWQLSLFHILVRWWSGQYCGGWLVCYIIPCPMLNTLRLTQNGRNFAADIFKYFYLMKIYEFWLKFHWSPFPISNIPALVQIMAWHQPGDKSLSEPMLVRLLAHICVTQPQRVNWYLMSR